MTPEQITAKAKYIKKNHLKNIKFNSYINTAILNAIEEAIKTEIK